jgi:U3 small nucleolar RNA-associated protein 6
MAEHVQASLDAMVAPLLDLQERQVFTPDEVRAILSRRRESEYKLRRRQCRKADFVSYLQEEMRLEQLRSLRAKRQKREEDQKRFSQRDRPQNDRQTKHIGDRHVLQHILLLWTRTLRKYRDDLGLWLSYIEFLKSTNRLYRKLSAVYGEALRFHPRATGLWIEASSYEFFERSNVDGARILLQRALRLNPTSRELWLQSFVLELHVAQKLEGRRRILLQGDGDDNKPSNEAESDAEANDDTNKQPVQGDPYVLAKIVIEHAAQQLKVDKDVHALYLECLQSCRSFPLESTRALQQDLLTKLKSASKMSDGSSTVLSWMAEAAWVRNTTRSRQSNRSESSEPISKRPRTDDASNNEPQKQYRDPVLQVLRNATHAVRTEEMYLEAIRFLSGHVRQLEERGNDDDSDDDAVHEAGSLLDALWAEARATDFFTPRMVLGYVDYLVENAEVDDDEGRVSDEAIQVLQDYIDSSAAAKQAAAGSIPAAVWLRLVQLQTPNMVDAIATLRRAIDHTPPYQRDHLTLLVQLMGALLEGKVVSSERSKELWSLMDRVLLTYPGTTLQPTDERAVDPAFGISNEACLALQQHVAEHEGLDGSRRLYEKLLFHSGFARCALQEEDGSHFLERIVDQAVAAESKCVLWKERRTNLLRIIDFALRTIPSKQSLDKYRKARDEIKYEYVTLRVGYVNLVCWRLTLSLCLHHSEWLLKATSVYFLPALRFNQRYHLLTRRRLTSHRS